MYILTPAKIGKKKYLKKEYFSIKDLGVFYI